jgi:dihydroorotase
VIKRERHRAALLNLVAQVDTLDFVFAGTDSAPHDRRKKECDCCSGGVFSAHAALESYLESFQQFGMIESLLCNRFLSVNGPKFYGLPVSKGRVELVQECWESAEAIQYSPNSLDTIRLFKPENRSFTWKLA